MKLTYDTSEHGSATEAVLELVDELTAELAGELVDLLPEALRGPVIRFMASSRAREAVMGAVKNIIEPRVSIDARGAAPIADIKR